MHIVYITSEYPTKNLSQGGIGSFINFIATSMVNLNHKVSVVGIYFGIQKETKEIIDRVEVHRIPVSNWRFFKFYDHKNQLIKKINDINRIDKIDIIEGSELSFAFFPKKTTYLKVLRLHGGHHFFAKELGKKINLWKSFREKKSFSRSDYFIAVSNYVGSQTKKHLNINFNFITIYNSVSIDKFKPLNESNSKDKQLLFVGTVCEKKGVRQLVEAMNFVVKEFPNAQLKIVGRDRLLSNGQSYSKLLKDSIPDEIKANIIITGPVPNSEIPKILNEAHICVYPSHMEAMPIAWLEALSCGKVLIASNIGPGKELIENYKTGVLVNPYDPKLIAKAIIDILKNKVLCKEIGVSARNHIVKNFNSALVVDKNINFYKSILP